jgi:peroxiredoxin
MKVVSRFVLWALAGVALSCVAPLAAAETLAIGEAAPDFCLRGVDGKDHRLADFRDAQVLVVVFTCNHCPTAQAYEDRIKQLAADYRGKHVALVAISPNDPQALRLDEMGFSDLGDSLAEMQLRAKDHAFNFPYLYDGQDQKVSRAYGPVATPHVFVFDRERRLRFSGRIDNSPQPDRATTHETRDAIEALLAGRAVPQPRTKTFGCSVKWSDKRAAVTQAAAAAAKEEVTLATVDRKALQALMKNDSKKLRLVNVWATWCGPCVTELADLAATNQMYRHRGFELLTVSANAPAEKDEALEMLRQKRLAAKNYLFTGSDKYELLDTIDKKSTGALPHTVLVAPGGKVLWSTAGPCDALALRRAIVAYLGRTYK